MAAAPAASFGQALPSDPEADSPSGVVYELPVDRARKDAAPRRETPQRDAPAPSGGGGGDTGGSSGTAPGSAAAAGGSTETSIRSENNFGTSSEVPGAPADRKQSKRSERSKKAAEGGDESEAGAVERVAGVAASSTGGPTDGPSDGVVFPLLAALLAVGAGIGAVAGRRSLRNRGGD
jgi:hypothetical protein